MFVYGLPFTLSRHDSSCVGFVVIRSGIWGCFWPFAVFGGIEKIANPMTASSRLAVVRQG
jgi:hypothetical protein